MEGSTVRRLVAGLVLLAALWALGASLLLSDLISRETALFDLAGERRLADLAAEYAAAFASLDRIQGGAHDTTIELPDRARVEADSRFIAERRAFLYSWGYFEQRIRSRWIIVYAAASIALLLLVAALGVVLFRRSLRLAAALVADLRSWSREGLIPRLRKTGDKETQALQSALIEALHAASERERFRRTQASVGEWRAQGRLLVHEIKNRLSPLRLGMDTLHDSSEALPEGQRAVLARMESNLLRLDDLLSAFRVFSGLPEPVYGQVDPAALLRAVAGRLDSGQRVAVGQAQGPSVVTDERYLDIIITNLILNALEADSDSRVLCAWKDRILTISDNGPGMDEETLARAFAAGFTTKDQGSGMGLAIVEGLCRILGIAVSVESAAGKGTAFRLDFKGEG